jgi:hypothetical protein
MEEGFVWRRVSESEKQEIRADSKKLLLEFSSKLASIKGIEEHFESDIEKSGQRDEGEPWNCDLMFRDLMFLNAPFVEDDFIVAEKGGWKK